MIPIVEVLLVLLSGELNVTPSSPSLWTAGDAPLTGQGKGQGLKSGAS